MRREQKLLNPCFVGWTSAARKVFLVSIGGALFGGCAASFERPIDTEVEDKAAIESVRVPERVLELSCDADLKLGDPSTSYAFGLSVIAVSNPEGSNSSDILVSLEATCDKAGTDTCDGYPLVASDVAGEPSCVGKDKLTLAWTGTAGDNGSQYSLRFSSQTDVPEITFAGAEAPSVVPAFRSCTASESKGTMPNGTVAIENGFLALQQRICGFAATDLSQ